MSIAFLKGKSAIAIFPPCPPLFSFQVIFGIITQLNQPYNLRRSVQLLRILHTVTSLALSYARKAAHMVHQMSTE